MVATRRSEAYDRLAFMTAKYTLALALAHNWLDIARACTRQIEDLSLANRLNLETENLLKIICNQAVNERTKLDNYAARVEEQMSILNSQIQEGVFND
jgi:hypothetical protein